MSVHLMATDTDRLYQQLGADFVWLMRPPMWRPQHPAITSENVRVLAPVETILKLREIQRHSHCAVFNYFGGYEARLVEPIGGEIRSREAIANCFTGLKDE